MAEPLNPSPYVTHLTRPLEEWKAGFSATSKFLETLSDLVYPELTASTPADMRPRGIDSQDWRERFDGVLESIRAHALFPDKDRNSDVLLKACLRLNVHFCDRPADYPSFNQHIMLLFEQFAASAQDIQQTVMAFDTASKHLSGLFMPLPSHASLTPAERLHYCLEMLEYEFRRRR